MIRTIVPAGSRFGRKSQKLNFWRKTLGCFLNNTTTRLFCLKWYGHFTLWWAIISAHHHHDLCNNDGPAAAVGVLVILQIGDRETSELWRKHYWLKERVNIISQSKNFHCTWIWDVIIRWSALSWAVLHNRFRKANYACEIKVRCKLEVLGN